MAAVSQSAQDWSELGRHFEDGLQPHRDVRTQCLVSEHFGELLRSRRNWRRARRARAPRRISIGLVEREYAETLPTRHREIGEGEVLAIGEDIVMRERFRRFGESAFAALFERLDNLPMQLSPCAP